MTDNAQTYLEMTEAQKMASCVNLQQRPSSFSLTQNLQKQIHKNGFSTKSNNFSKQCNNTTTNGMTKSQRVADILKKRGFKQNTLPNQKVKKPFPYIRTTPSQRQISKDSVESNTNQHNLAATLDSWRKIYQPKVTQRLSNISRDARSSLSSDRWQSQKQVPSLKKEDKERKRRQSDLERAKMLKTIMDRVRAQNNQTGYRKKQRFIRTKFAVESENATRSPSVNKAAETPQSTSDLKRDLSSRQSSMADSKTTVIEQRRNLSVSRSVSVLKNDASYSLRNSGGRVERIMKGNKVGNQNIQNSPQKSDRSFTNLSMTQILKYGNQMTGMMKSQTKATANYLNNQPVNAQKDATRKILPLKKSGRKQHYSSNLVQMANRFRSLTSQPSLKKGISQVKNPTISLKVNRKEYEQEAQRNQNNQFNGFHIELTGETERFKSTQRDHNSNQSGKNLEISQIQPKQEVRVDSKAKDAAQQQKITSILSDIKISNSKLQQSAQQTYKSSSKRLQMSSGKKIMNQFQIPNKSNQTQQKSRNDQISNFRSEQNIYSTKSSKPSLTPGTIVRKLLHKKLEKIVQQSNTSHDENNRDPNKDGIVSAIREHNYASLQQLPRRNLAVSSLQTSQEEFQGLQTIIKEQERRFNSPYKNESTTTHEYESDQNLDKLENESQTNIMLQSRRQKYISTGKASKKQTNFMQNLPVNSATQYAQSVYEQVQHGIHPSYLDHEFAQFYQGSRKSSRMSKLQGTKSQKVRISGSEQRPPTFLANLTRHVAKLKSTKQSTVREIQLSKQNQVQKQHLNNFESNLQRKQNALYLETDDRQIESQLLPPVIKRANSLENAKTFSSQNLHETNLNQNCDKNYATNTNSNLNSSSMRIDLPQCATASSHNRKDLLATATVASANQNKNSATLKEHIGDFNSQVFRVQKLKQQESEIDNKYGGSSKADKNYNRASSKQSWKRAKNLSRKRNAPHPLLEGQPAALIGGRQSTKTLSEYMTAIQYKKSGKSSKQHQSGAYKVVQKSKATTQEIQSQMKTLFALSPNKRVQPSKQKNGVQNLTDKQDKELFKMDKKLLSQTPNLILNNQERVYEEKIRSEEAADMASNGLISRDDYEQHSEDSNPLKIAFSHSLGYERTDQPKNETYQSQIPFNQPSSPTCFSQNIPESPKKESQIHFSGKKPGHNTKQRATEIQKDDCDYEINSYQFLQKSHNNHVAKSERSNPKDTNFHESFGVLNSSCSSADLNQLALQANNSTSVNQINSAEQQTVCKEMTARIATTSSNQQEKPQPLLMVQQQSSYLATEKKHSERQLSADDPLSSYQPVRASESKEVSVRQRLVYLSPNKQQQTVKAAQRESSSRRIQNSPFGVGISGNGSSTHKAPQRINKSIYTAKLWSQYEGGAKRESLSSKAHPHQNQIQKKKPSSNANNAQQKDTQNNTNNGSSTSATVNKVTTSLLPLKKEQLLSGVVSRRQQATLFQGVLNQQHHERQSTNKPQRVLTRNRRGQTRKMTVVANHGQVETSSQTQHGGSTTFKKVLVHGTQTELPKKILISSQQSVAHKPDKDDKSGQQVQNNGSVSTGVATTINVPIFDQKPVKFVQKSLMRDNIAVLGGQNSSVISPTRQRKKISSSTNGNNAAWGSINVHQIVPSSFLGSKRMADNYPNSSYAVPTQVQQGKNFRFQLFTGNNHLLVRRVMSGESRGFIWSEISSAQSHFQFRWAPTSRSINFDRLSHNMVQMANHFEHHAEITTKNELFRNLKTFYEERQQNVFYTLPLTFCIRVQPDRQTQSIKQQMKPFKEIFKLLEEFKGDLTMDKENVGEIKSTEQTNNAQAEAQQSSNLVTDKLEKGQAILEQNPLNSPKNNQLQIPLKVTDNSAAQQDSTKSSKFKEIIGNTCSVLLSKKGLEVGYKGLSLHIQDNFHSQIKSFTSRSSGLIMPLSHFHGQNVWILKPTGFNRGKGIHVVNNLKKLKQLIKDYSRGKDNPGVTTQTTTANQSNQQQQHFSANFVTHLKHQLNGSSSQVQSNTTLKTPPFIGVAGNTNASSSFKASNLLTKSAGGGKRVISMSKEANLYGLLHATTSNNSNQDDKDEDRGAIKETNGVIHKETTTLQGNPQPITHIDDTLASNVGDQLVHQAAHCATEGPLELNNQSLENTPKKQQFSRLNETPFIDDDLNQSNLEDLNAVQIQSPLKTTSTAFKESAGVTPQQQQLQLQSCKVSQLATSSVSPTKPQQNLQQSSSNQQQILQQSSQVQSVYASKVTTPAGGIGSTSTANTNSNTTTGYQKSQNIRTQTFIIQKYIERPLLINKRKFDIRVWVMVNHDQDIFFFKEGYLRTSTTEYNFNLDDLDDDFVHLTNNAIQKNAPGYGKHEDGNQLTFDFFRDYMKKTQKEKKKGEFKANFDRDVLPWMKYIAGVTLLSIRKKLNAKKRKTCFELFGLDYFLDEDYNTFLIEVNTNPCLEESSSILRSLLPRMLDDMFKLTIDQVFQPTREILMQHNSSLKNIQADQQIQKKPITSWPNPKSYYQVQGYKDSENMWEKIGTLRTNISNPLLISAPKKPTKDSESISQKATENNQQIPMGNSQSYSNRLLHLVNPYEMRVGRPDIIEKLHKRDTQFLGASHLSHFDL